MNSGRQRASFAAPRIRSQARRCGKVQRRLVNAIEQIWRMQRARELLAATRLSIAAIAERVGYITETPRVKKVLDFGVSSKV